MRLALTGLCLVLLTACGDGLLGFGKKSNDDAGDASAPAVSSGDVTPVCVAEVKEGDDTPVRGNGKAAKQKKDKPEQAGNGRKKETEENEDENNDDESSPSEENANAPAAPCPPESELDVPVSTASVSFTKDIAPVMNASCVSCHNASRADGGIALDTLEAVRSTIDATIASIVGGRMPIGGVPRVSAAQVELLKQWKATDFGD